MQLKITTFNCENLFGRYRFLDKFPVTAVKDFETMLQIPDVVALEGRSGGIKPAPVAKSQRITTGKAILGAKPDILAVEEVENLATLRIFNDRYMGNYFDRIVLIDGNDARGIDVGLLIRKGLKADVMAIRTHVDDALAGGFLPKSTRLDTRNVAKAVFSRDCLEVDVKIAGKTLTFLINHFKAQDGKATSTRRRVNQAKRVAEIVEDVHNAGKLPIVMGDLNMDTGQSDYDNSLQALVTSQSLVDPFQNVPDHWTHFFASKKTVSRLDYILLDKSLAGAVTGTGIFRNGLSPKCKQFTGPRLPSMSGNDLEASDHCPTSVILQL